MVPTHDRKFKSDLEIHPRTWVVIDDDHPTHILMHTKNSMRLSSDRYRTRKLSKTFCFVSHSKTRIFELR